MNQNKPTQRSSENYQNLAREILYLASRDGQSEGSPLRVGHLAEQLNISRTPVSAALKYLADMGIVEHRRNSGFFLTSPAHEAERSLDASLAKNEFHLRFARDVLKWGDGHSISVSQLIKLYSISRGQAQQLVETANNQGWLEKSAGHNWIVRLGISNDEDYSRLYRFRETIEPAALREPDYAPDSAELERLATIQRRLAGGDFKKLSAIDLFEINREFHETIVSWSGNRFYLDALRRSNDLRRLIEYSKVMKTEKIDDFASEHLAILDEIKLGKYEQAAFLVLQHLQGAGRAKT